MRNVVCRLLALFVLVVVTGLGVLLMTGCPTSLSEPSGGDGGGSGDADDATPGDTVAPGDPLLTVTRVGAGQISLTWQEPGDDDYSHLVLSIDPADAAEAGVDKGTTTYQFTGLTGDREYTITAKSVDEAGNLSAGRSVTLTLSVNEMDVKMISTAAELAAIDDDLESLNDYYILTADIDLAGVEWVPIGNDSDPQDLTVEEPFAGILEGNGHTIRNLAIDSRTNGDLPSEYVGLFENVGSEAEATAAIRNLFLDDVEIHGTGYNQDTWDRIGSLVAGYNFGTIENCRVSGVVEAHADNAYVLGGMVHRNRESGMIRACSSEVSIAATDGAGGLVGGNMGLVVDSSSSAIITPVDGYNSSLVGGLVGQNTRYDGLSDPGVIDGCSSTGSAEGYDDVGGLVGNLNSGTVLNSSSSATVTGHDGVGGLIGSVAASGAGYTATVLDCHSDSAVSGAYDVGGLVGGMGRLGNTATVTGCYASGSAYGVQRTGGLIGSSTNSAVTDCYTDGVVTRTGSYVGGLIGESLGTVSRCYSNVTFDGGYASQMGGLIGANYGPVSDSFSLGPVNNLDDQGGDNVGGLVGSNEPDGSIIRCYSTGQVVGATNLGGLVGANSGTVSDSFYDTENSGTSVSAGGTPKTTAQMTNVATFTDTTTAGLDNPWDFVGNPNNDSGNDDYWSIGAGANDGYPYLQFFQ